MARVEKRAHLKYEGTDTSLPVPLGTIDAMREDFERQYRARFSFLMPDRALIAEAVSVEAVGRSDAPRESAAAGRGPRAGDSRWNTSR